MHLAPPRNGHYLCTIFAFTILTGCGGGNDAGTDNGVQNIASTENQGNAATVIDETGNTASAADIQAVSMPQGLYEVISDSVTHNRNTLPDGIVDTVIRMHTEGNTTTTTYSTTDRNGTTENTVTLTHEKQTDCRSSAAGVAPSALPSGACVGLGYGYLDRIQNSLTTVSDWSQASCADFKFHSTVKIEKMSSTEWSETIFETEAGNFPPDSPHIGFVQNEAATAPTASERDRASERLRQFSAEGALPDQKEVTSIRRYKWIAGTC